LATLLERHTLAEKAKRVGQLVTLPVLWTGVVIVLNLITVGGSDDYAFPWSVDALFGGIGQYLTRFLLNVPDLLAYILAFFVTVVVCARPIFGALRSEPPEPSTRDQGQQEPLVLGYSGVLILFFILLFMVALPAATGYTIVLPRYYVIILPFLLLCLGYGVNQFLGRRLDSPAAVCFVLLSVFFALNTNGALYPLDINTEGPGNDPPLTERSNAYRRLLALEMSAIRALEELPEGVPPYYGHYEHYLREYPGGRILQWSSLQRAQLLRGVVGRVHRGRADAPLRICALQLSLARGGEDPGPDPIRRNDTGTLRRGGPGVPGRSVRDNPSPNSKRRRRLSCLRTNGAGRPGLSVPGSAPTIPEAGRTFGSPRSRRSGRAPGPETPGPSRRTPQAAAHLGWSPS